MARNPNHLDLFVTGTDGRIYSTWWDAAGGWANWFNVSGGAATTASPVDAIARYPDHLDLFVTSTDGRIYSTWWDPASEQVRLHVKILSEPTSVTRAAMVQAMQQVYASVGIDVVVASVENLNLPLLNDLDVGACTMGSTTIEQNQRCCQDLATTPAPTTGLRLLVRKSTIPAAGHGCAASATGQPGAVVTSVASPVDASATVGPLLGPMPHVAPTDRL